MNQLIISLLIICIILIIIYNTRYGIELKNKCNNTVGYIADAVVDLSRDPDVVYQETQGDFYDIKAKASLKKFLAIPIEKRTAMDNYKIGNLYRYHVKNPKLTHYYYRLALEQMRNKPSTGNVQMLDRMGDYEIRDDQIDHNIPEIRELIAEDLMIRRIEELGDVVQPRNINIVQPIQSIHPVQPIHPIHPVHPVRQTNSRIAEVVNNVKILGDDKRNKFFKSMRKWTPDPQNVHDSHISDDVVKSYDIIVAGLPPLVDADLEIQKYVNELAELKNNGTISKTVYDNAMITIKNMKDFEHSRVGDTEQNILANVVRRINIPENMKNRKDMVVSLATNLADSVKKNNLTNMPVCISGRVAGVIESLAHMDKDPGVGILKTKEAIRNEVFQTAHHEYMATQKMALDGNNDTLKKGAEDMRDGEDSPESIEFEKLVKENIKNRLQRDYANHIDVSELNTLISQANMAF
jgi:hypothetical protein